MVGIRVDRSYTDEEHAGKVLVLQDPDSIPQEHLSLLLGIFQRPAAATVSLVPNTLRVYVMEALESGLMDNSRSMTAAAVIDAVKRRDPRE